MDIRGRTMEGDSWSMEGSWSPPETHYARSGDFSIAFQVLGAAPIDLVFVPGFVSNLELTWDWPPLGAFYRAFASFARVILFDKRGTGLSDRVRLMPTTEERMDDLRAVMDASGCERAAVVGVSEGAPLAISFAASCPERIAALILYAPLPKATRADDYPWAQSAEWWEDTARHFERSWGSPEYMHADVAWRAPSESGNEAFVRWWGVYRRLGASPGAAADLTRMNARIDVRDLLPKIRAPTLVLARDRDRVISADHARYVAERIPGATYLELPGEDHLPFVGDATSIVTAVARMLGVDGDLSIDVPSVPLRPAEFPERGAAAVLSARERDVLKWVARGKTNAEIATALYISESTVRKHLQNSYRKLGVPSRTAAVALLSARGT
jgi:pimeloyl-ACP methyl ester carboxylesterase/DNA-binding CsgD family transcriptional regulator